MVIFVEFLIDGKPCGHYWMNHANEDERKCLGHRCKVAFEEGTCVYTAPVSKVGEFPKY